MTENISITQTNNLEFLNEINLKTLNYWGEELSLIQVKERLENSLNLNKNNRIFLIKKDNKISCFFMYRETMVLPTWVLCNFFILNHGIFSPNILGFGYGLDEAVKLGEKNNKNSFFWVVEKSTFKRRFKSGLRDLKNRNSILNNYSFNLYADSEIHTDYKFIDSLTGKSNLPCFVILASKKIDINLF